MLLYVCLVLNVIICVLGVECAFRYAVEHTDLEREIIVKWIQLKQRKRQMLTYFSYVYDTRKKLKTK